VDCEAGRISRVDAGDGPLQRANGVADCLHYGAIAVERCKDVLGDNLSIVSAEDVGEFREHGRFVPARSGNNGYEVFGYRGPFESNQA